MYIKALHVSFLSILKSLINNLNKNFNLGYVDEFYANETVVQIKDKKH